MKDRFPLRAFSVFSGVNRKSIYSTVLCHASIVHDHDNLKICPTQRDYLFLLFVDALCKF